MSKTPKSKLPSIEVEPNTSEAQQGATPTVASSSSSPEGAVGKSQIVRLARFFVQPLLLVVTGLLLLSILGVAQRWGWFSDGPTSANTTHGGSVLGSVDYICPMMCTPPQKEPGRCPVCAMELVPATATSSSGDEYSIAIEPAARRIANIETTVVSQVNTTRRLRVTGELSYDEGKMKTISAYTPGRFDQVYVDYTGANVSLGDRLASFFSPELYTAQVEFLQALAARKRVASLEVVAESDRRLLQAARQRLVELGMSDKQIDSLRTTSTPQSRLDIVAPIQGTVIEKLIVQGATVKPGDPLFRLADLSTLWLILELFPEDAARVRYGQRVSASLQSMPGHEFRGRVAFVDPEVEQQSRTVRVRVVLDNSDGLMRVGDYARATIELPLGERSRQLRFDPELANKWISPRHPEIILEAPGPCPRCGADLVSAESLGYTDQPVEDSTVIVVPHSAVLKTANESVVYVEREVGRFEIQRVTVGATAGDQIVIVEGLVPGDVVASRGGFLIDSQMQLSGNPSLIDPRRAPPPTKSINGLGTRELHQIYQLPESDHEAAIQQRKCPISDSDLGGMGVPFKVKLQGTTVYLCCQSCQDALNAKPEFYLEKLETLRNSRVDSTIESATPGDDEEGVEQSDGEAPGQPVSISGEDSLPAVDEAETGATE